jgi:hypothetical protein
VTPADIESMARAYESDARSYTRCALHGMDEVERLKRLAEERACDVAKEMGLAAGLFFRADELRYDARGGMTEALERRRFEPGARWTTLWSEGEVHTAWRREERHDEARIHFDNIWPATVELMTGNGWLFLGLSDLGGYR